MEIEDSIYLYEVNADGSGMRCVCFIGLNEYYSGMSSAGDWVVYSRREGINGEDEICVVRRGGSERYNTGVRGRNPDFSPDASKIVYEKPDSGIWVMDRDGSNNHCIVPDADAKYPAWSPDDSLIAYGYFGMQIYNIKSDSIIREYERVGIPDWGPSGSNEIIVEAYDGPCIIDIVTGEIDSMGNLIKGNRAKWSPDGLWFIAYDGDWFVISADGTNKWYLKDLIE